MKKNRIFPTSKIIPNISNSDGNILRLEIESLLSNKDEENKATRKYIVDKLNTNKEQYIEQTSIRFVVGTWNVNNHIVSKKDFKNLKQWLCVSDNADFYVIGLQEIDISALSILKEETAALEKWDVVLRKTFDDHYEILVSRQLVGLYLGLVVKKKIKKHLSNLSIGKLNCGVLNILGNKGGIAIRFDISNNSFCFLNSHLAAHQKNVERRNQDQNYLENIEFVHLKKDILFSPLKMVTTQCQDHDVFFWFGDLNYRVDLDYNTVIKCIKKNNIKEILKYDQLGMEMKKGKAFKGYSEGEIRFWPTYKWVFFFYFLKNKIIGKNKYHEEENHKVLKRIPSYTDRILFHKNEKIQVLYYNSFEDLKISDHKPLVGVYNINLKVTNKDKFKNEFFKHFSFYKNKQIPKVEVSKNELNFKNVRFGIPQTDVIELSNVGSSQCEYVVKYSLSDDKKANEKISSWVRIYPQKGILLPKEKMEIRFTLKVSKFASLLNKLEKIEHIFVLKVLKGSDHFISLNSDYVKSSFGEKIENLVNFEVGMELPVTVMKIVNYLRKNGLKEPKIFLNKGNNKNILKIRNLIDKNKSLDDYDGDVCSMGFTCLYLLSSFESSVIKTNLNECVISMLLWFEAGNTKETTLQLIFESLENKMKKENFNLFNYIITFLKFLLKNNKDLEKSTIASVFSKVLFTTRKTNDSKLIIGKSESEIESLKSFLERIL